MKRSSIDNLFEVLPARAPLTFLCPHCAHEPFHFQHRLAAHIQNVHPGLKTMDLQPSASSGVVGEAYDHEDDSHSRFMGHAADDCFSERDSMGLPSKRVAFAPFGFAPVAALVAGAAPSIALSAQLDGVARIVDEGATFFEAVQGIAPAQVAKLIKALETELHVPTSAEFDLLRRASRSTGVVITLLAELSFVVIPPTVFYQRLMSASLRGLLVQMPQIMLKDGKRVFSSYVSALHFEHICAASLGRLRLCLSFYSDSTTVVTFGNRSMHPVYLIIMNVAESFPEEERRFLAGFVPVLSPSLLRKLGIRSSDWARFRAQVFHRVIGTLARMGGMTIHDPDGIRVRPWCEEQEIQVFPILCAYLGDRPELLMVARRFVSHSGKLQRACRRCGVSGCDLHVVMETLDDPVNIDLDEAIREAIRILNDPQRGELSGVRDFSRQYSTVLVESGLHECKFWDEGACTPRCSLHTAELVMEGYMVRWVACLSEVTDEQLSALNMRILFVDPALGDEIYVVKTRSLNPSVKTAKHLHRVFEALSVAVRGWLLDDYTCDRIVLVFSLWRRFYALWMAPQFTEAQMDEMSRVQAAFSSELQRAFSNLSASNFDFPSLHELTHVAQDRLMYGHDRVTTTQLLENFHIEAVKNPFRGSNKSTNQVAIGLQIIESFVLKRMVKPIPSFAHITIERALDGFVGRGKVISLRNLIENRSLAAPGYNWEQLMICWHALDQFAFDSKIVTVYSQYCFQNRNICANPKHYGFPNWSIISVIERDMQFISFARVMAIFSASSLALPSSMGNSFLFVQFLEQARTDGIMCPRYCMVNVRESPRFGVVPTHTLSRIWSSIRYVRNVCVMKESYGIVVQGPCARGAPSSVLLVDGVMAWPLRPQNRAIIGFYDWEGN